VSFGSLIAPRARSLRANCASRTLDLAFTHELGHLEEDTAILRVVITHLLATESFIDFERLDEETLERPRAP
jgi:hypothetical protein